MVKVGGAGRDERINGARQGRTVGDARTKGSCSNHLEVLMRFGA